MLKALEILEAAGAVQTGAKTSVVDKFHRADDVPNLFIVDGSGFVTGGGNHPVVKSAKMEV